MGKCLFMRKGETHTAPVNYKANFADNTWEQIIDACQKNAVPDTWLVGDQKTMTINGTDYAIDIIGKNHDDYANGSGKAPLTFQLHDCYSEYKLMNSKETNVGGWKSSLMRTTHMPAFIELLPNEVVNALREVNKLTGAGNTSSSVVTTVDKLFLLSAVEVFGGSGTSFIYVNEGNQYDYYKAGNSKIKMANGVNNDWWLRSPYRSNNKSFCRVNYSGSAAGAYPNLEDFYVSFAFCF